jgi:hypothetical protein
VPLWVPLANDASVPDSQTSLRPRGSTGAGFAGVKVRWRPCVQLHDLRHTFATMVQAELGDLRVTQVVLGHADIRMTLRYSHVSETRLAEAARASALVRPPDVHVASPRVGVPEHVVRPQAAEESLQLRRENVVDGEDPRLTALGRVNRIRRVRRSTASQVKPSNSPFRAPVWTVATTIGRRCGAQAARSAAYSSEPRYLVRPGGSWSAFTFAIGWMGSRSHSTGSVSIRRSKASSRLTVAAAFFAWRRAVLYRSTASARRSRRSTSPSAPRSGLKR